MEQPISLYIGLVEGHRADLAATARAALAFEAALKEIAFFVDPTIEISIALESGTEGSLHLNSFIQAVRGRVPDKNTLRMIAYGAVGWLCMETASHFYDRILSTIYAEEPGISADDASAIAKEVVRLMDGGVAQSQVEQVYEELSKDENVTEVGVTTLHDERPKYPVPRAHFNLSSRVVAVDETGNTRWIEREETVLLVSPVLLPAHRKWKFSFHEGEFGAPILDDQFLERLLSGREPVPMTAGISMRVLLRTKQELIQGVWAVKDRQIIKVFAVTPAMRQRPLDL